MRKLEVVIFLAVFLVIACGQLALAAEPATTKQGTAAASAPGTAVATFVAPDPPVQMIVLDPMGKPKPGFAVIFTHIHGCRLVGYECNIQRAWVMTGPNGIAAFSFKFSRQEGECVWAEVPAEHFGWVREPTFHACGGVLYMPPGARGTIHLLR